jgi:hypothetical protein
MPEYRVVRVIHEIKIIDAPDEESAIDNMKDYGSDEVDIECPEIYAEERN